LANGFDVGHVLFGGVVGGDGSGGELGRGRDGFGAAGEGEGGEFVEREVVLKALDDLFFAVHEVDVVAKEEVKVFDAVAGEFELDGVELEEEVVAEGAKESEAGVFGMAEGFNEAAEDGESGGLAAALLFGEEGGQGFEEALEAAGGEGFEALPMGVVGEDTVEDLDENGAAGVEGAELEVAPGAEDF
jgi:hypothetical protein